MLDVCIRKHPKTLYLLLGFCLLAISSWLFWSQIQNVLTAMFMVLMGVLMIVFAVVVGIVVFVRDPASFTTPPTKDHFHKPPSSLSQSIGDSGAYKNGLLIRSLGKLHSRIE